MTRYVDFEVGDEVFPIEIADRSILDFNCMGVAGCNKCGWRGVATFVAGVRQDDCPACGIAEPRAEFPGLFVKRIPKVGRNDPCPCGSGAKYKKCHGR